jgi:hypothetical protein
MRYLSYALFYALYVCLLLTSCSDRPPMFQVRGQVVYKDTREPVTRVGIVFESTTPPYLRSSGRLDEEGRFNLSTDRQDSGAIQGEHRVCFVPAYEGVGFAEMLKIMPAKYQAFHTSDIRVVIEPNQDNNFVIEVSRK